jgi:DNA mismatch repair protein MutS
MMRQYADAKRRHPDCIVLFRMGDFYEMFGEDARQGAELLDLVLTSRDREEPKMPMAGVPHHALEQYLGRLLKAGRKVAICDQMEDPSKAKGLVRRDVTRVVTPGTVFDTGLLEDRTNNYLAAVVRVAERYGVAWADVSTGEFLVGEVPADNGAMEGVLAELSRARPAEVICPEGAAFESSLGRRLNQEFRATLSPWRPEAFHPAVASALLKERFRLASLEGLGFADGSAAAAAAGAILAYVDATQMGRPTAIKAPKSVSSSSTLEMDPVTQRNLELTRNLRDGSERGTLLSLLDRTTTAMGGRLLRSWVTRPLVDVQEIVARQDAVAFLVGNAMLRERLRQALRGVHDVERLVSRTVAGLATPRDLVAVRASLDAIAATRGALAGSSAAGVQRPPLILDLTLRLDDFQALRNTLEAAFVDVPPATAREGGLIRAGYSPELDKLKAETAEAREWIAGLQARERERTGIRGLKVGYNKIFGFYIEVSRGLAGNVPGDYERRQTLVNAERFVTPDLKQHEELVLSADEQINALEERLFKGLSASVAASARGLLAVAEAVATLDVFNALSSVAADRGHTRPTVDASTTLAVRDGRHPVVEVAGLESEFVPNDTNLDAGSNQLMIITGPNMAGKSTYMRQVALIVVLAQMGAFVPAAEARVGMVDRILTRVGATDYVSSGQSTFMVEMVETARILNLASDRSLVLLDEIGRGTSTFDGLSIAWAVAEYLHDGPGAHPRTMFATHYHQLTDLSRGHPRVVNYHLTAREHDGGIVFVRKLLPGSTDKSYGIQVAKLAGIPAAVIERAGEILRSIEEQHAIDLAGGAGDGARLDGGLAAAHPPSPERAFTQTLLFRKEGAERRALPIIERLQGTDPESITPMEALRLLEELRGMAKDAGDPNPVQPTPAKAPPRPARTVPKGRPRKGGG